MKITKNIITALILLFCSQTAYSQITSAKKAKMESMDLLTEMGSG